MGRAPAPPFQAHDLGSAEFILFMGANHFEANYGPTTLSPRIMGDAALPVTPAVLAELARQGAGLDLLAILRQALGAAEEVTIALGDRSSVDG